MTELASPAQLRAALLRWSLVLVPGTLLLGMLSGLMAGSGVESEWHAALIKPANFPLRLDLPLVLSSIPFVLMGLALALVVTARGAPGRGAAIAVWLVLFGLALAWAPLFFGAHQISSALYLLLAIDLAALVALALFWRVRPLAGMLLLPVLAWALYATLFTWQLLELNPGADGAAGAVSVVEI